MAMNLPMPVQAPTIITTLSEVRRKGLGLLSLDQRWDKTMEATNIRARKEKME